MSNPDRSADFDVYLRPTSFIDSDHPDVRDYAIDLTRGATTDQDKALAIFYPVRDDFLYSPYGVVARRRAMTASYTLKRGTGFCVQKAVLLAAAARAVGVPARLAFADVRNHLSTKRLRALMDTDLFIWHGYTELYLDDRWVKATPAFNLALCERFGVVPLDFDGRTDSILQEYDRDGRRHMEYVADRGAYADLPFDEMFDDFKALYPRWLEEPGSNAETSPEEDFYSEAAQENRTTAE